MPSRTNELKNSPRVLWLSTDGWFLSGKISAEKAHVDAQRVTLSYHGRQPVLIIYIGNPRPAMPSPTLLSIGNPVGLPPPSTTTMDKDPAKDVEKQSAVNSEAQTSEKRESRVRQVPIPRNLPIPNTY